MSTTNTFSIPIGKALGFSVGGIGGMIALNFTIYSYSLWVIVLVNSVIIIATLLFILISLWVKGKGIVKNLREEESKLDELNQRHNALASRFDTVLEEKSRLEQQTFLLREIYRIQQTSLEQHGLDNGPQKDVILQIEEMERSIGINGSSLQDHQDNR